MNLVGNVLLMLVEFYLLNSDDDMNRSELLDSMLMRRFVNGSRSSQLNQRKKERKKEKENLPLIEISPQNEKKRTLLEKKTMACIHKSSLSSSDRHFQPIRSIRLRARPKELKASLGRPLTTTKKKERKWPIKLATV